MLIPSIDLLGGRVVQLRQGADLMFADDDLERWVSRFARFPIVQVIDLDAALGRGDNGTIVRRLCAARPCQVGGGLRSVDAAMRAVDAGAARVIVGSAFFDDTGVNEERAREFSAAVGADRLIAAIDCRDGKVVTRGWTQSSAIAPTDAARTLQPFVDAFLYTQVEIEGTMQGLAIEPVLALKAATSRRIIAAGGIRNHDEVDALDRLGVDAVVGMAIYTQAMSIERS
jgi:phosphoribosylformimino-5-aminoimidazole carboxamide ribotide isomerase